MKRTWKKKGKGTVDYTKRKILESRYIDRLTNENLIAKRNVENWLEFSTNPQTERDIRRKLIEEIKRDDVGKYVCLSYVCRYSKLSEDFIDELNYLSSISKENLKEYYRYYRMNTVNHKNVFKTINIKRSRLDWYSISTYQKLSETFIERHKNDVLWSVVLHTQDLSKEFKQEHRHYYETSLELNDSLKESGDMS